jgi:hypothetical protein
MANRIQEEALEIVDSHLALLEALFQGKDALMQYGAKGICRCRSCRSFTERTLSWIAGFDAAKDEDSIQPIKRRSRIFPIRGRAPTREV